MFAGGTAALAGPFAVAPAGLALGLGFAAAKLAADNEIRSAAIEQRESVCSDLAASGLLYNAGNYVGPGARFISTGGGSGCWIEKVGEA